MKINPLAVVVPVETGASGKDKLRTGIWETVVDLLLPALGKHFNRFEPATFAWKQKLDKPFGVILGKEDPGLFLYYYAAAKAMQQHMIKRHMRPILESLNPIVKNQKEGLTVYAVELKNDGMDMGTHMLWHLAMITGEVQPDCGLYFAAEKEAYASDALEKQVLENLERYAICVVNLIAEEASQ